MERNRFYVDGIKDYYYTIRRSGDVISFKVISLNTGEEIDSQDISRIDIFKVQFFYNRGTRAERGMEFIFQRAHKLAKMIIKSVDKYT